MNGQRDVRKYLNSARVCFFLMDLQTEGDHVEHKNLLRVHDEGNGKGLTVRKTIRE